MFSDYLLKPGGTFFDNVDRPKFSAIFTIMADKNWEMNISTNLYAKEGYNAGSQTVWWIKPRQATEIVTDNPQNKLESLDSLEPSEQWLAIWRKVLNMEVTLTDRLQDLGADSIDIVEIDHWGSHLISNPSSLSILAYGSVSVEKNRPEDLTILSENSFYFPFCAQLFGFPFHVYSQQGLFHKLFAGFSDPSFRLPGADAFSALPKHFRDYNRNPG